MQQEELVQLFADKFCLSQKPQYPSPVPVEQFPQHENDLVPSAAPITYVSQHYTHSYHVIPTAPSVVTPLKTTLDEAQLESVLRQHRIDPSLLFPSQIGLFQNADDDQRLRLLELWSISPPQGRQSHLGGADFNLSRQLYDWPPTSLAQEEAMAKLRFERQAQEQAQSEEILMHEEQLHQSMLPNESAAVQATRSLLTSSPDAYSAEPYILSGYDMLAKRDYEESAQAAATHLQESTKYNQSTDPAYKTDNGTSWQKHVGSIVDMENQYGAFAHARDYDTRPYHADEEMVM
ncbi:hypothetical protein M011DRAFT_285448 [Sporormia fimetaria CBS 119925]|uniref:Uncharacterized protein n=1 Tax=Sporormia fimetaria CBS 119925 TaxID=1340428 RepID=A0A6A6VIK7_9PLEO|nr:hypothetical protein M011DRAFT_285448 [Sporormia fimetaria CBS 119925]